MSITNTQKAIFLYIFLLQNLKNFHSLHLLMYPTTCCMIILKTLYYKGGCMKKRPDITQQTKNNIMEAFWELYKNKRIEKITIKEITTLAGYNRSTFYEYFTDVYDVLEQLEDRILPNLEELPPIKIVDFTKQIDSIIQLYQERKEYYNVLLGDKGDPAFQDKMKKTIKPLLLESIGNIEDEHKNALDYGLEYTLSAMIGVMSYWFRHENPIPMEELIAIIYELSKNNMIQKLTNNINPNSNFS